MGRPHPPFRDALRWMNAYAAATASTASLETIRDAATGGEGQKPAKSTTQPYREFLQRLFIVDELPAWAPTRNRISRLAMPPKHHPRTRPRRQPARSERRRPDVRRTVGPPSLRDGPLLGALFESLVTLSVRVYAQATRARVSHLRTRNGDHEVDLIVERRDGRILAIEAKLLGRARQSRPPPPPLARPGDRERPARRGRNHEPGRTPTAGPIGSPSYRRHCSVPDPDGQPRLGAADRPAQCRAGWEPWVLAPRFCGFPGNTEANVPAL